jgi:hypothetical protein
VQTGAAAGDTGSPVESLQVADGVVEDPGPVPPETGMALFVVEGALLPLGCFDKDAGKTLGGDACLEVVPTGAEVRVASETASAVHKVGKPTEPLCTLGKGKKNALAAEGLGEGANLTYAVWPRSAFRTVKLVPQETLSDEARVLGDAEKAALARAIGRDGDVEAHQVAVIDASGPDAGDKVFSAFIRHPSEPERYRWSGLFVAEGGDLDKLHLLERSKSNEDVFEVRGVLDLEGDGNSELWLRIVFEEGSGDRLVKLDDWKPTPLARWTCGA